MKQEVTSWKELNESGLVDTVNKKVLNPKGYNIVVDGDNSKLTKLIYGDEPFDYLVELYMSKTTGPRVDSAIIEGAKALSAGKDHNLTYQGKRRAVALIEKLSHWSDKLCNWPSDIDEQFKAMVSLTGGRDFKRTTIEAVKEAFNSDEIIFRIAKKHNTNMLNIIHAKDKLESFSKAAQDYKKLLE
ncbi:hypothetical protein TW1_001 [Pseudoalteromonas phage TW1]|uniref:hypothetical protein n=1 Tax=Pseudoalteromonas phage TW1 TaxID=1366055 RepID=UPI00035AB043|nr:hypothetical protein PP585_gp01 [Pseudoalteromonas phage TW1]AGR46517.1 hypothetical protein TW1_001 [Pseudoalteromonas phage TW1]